MGRFINADAFASTGQGLLGNNMFAYCLNRPTVYADDNGKLASKIENEITPDGASIVGKKTIHLEEGTVSVVVVEYDEMPVHMMQLDNTQIEVGRDSIDITFPDGNTLTLNYDEKGFELDSFSCNSDLLVTPTVNEHGVGVNCSTSMNGISYSIGVFFTIDAIEEGKEQIARKIFSMLGGGGAPSNYGLSYQSGSLNYASLCAGGGMKNVTLMFM